MREHLALFILCCLVPLVALTATVWFDTPTIPTVGLALLVLLPVGYGLLTPARRPAGHDEGHTGPKSR